MNHGIRVSNELIEELLSILYSGFERKFLITVSNDFNFRMITYEIFDREINQYKINHKILFGILSVMNVSSSKRRICDITIEEIIPRLDKIKILIGSRNKFKSLKNISSSIILEIFASLYFDYNRISLLSPESNEGRKINELFKKNISKLELIKASENLLPDICFYFANHGVKILIHKRDETLNDIINKFYK